MGDKNIKANGNSINTNPGNFVHYGRADYQIRERFTRKGGDKVFLRLMMDSTDSRGKDIIVLEDEVTKPEWFVDSADKKLDIKAYDKNNITIPANSITDINVWYHITLEQNMDNILKNGLNVSQYSDFVFIHPDKEVTKSKIQWLNWKNKPCAILTLNIPNNEVFISIPEKYKNDIEFLKQHIDGLDFGISRNVMPNEIVNVEHINSDNKIKSYHEAFIYANVDVSQDESNMVKWAKKELELLNMYNGDEMNEKLADSIIYMLREFGKVGHSGSSAWWTADILNRLLNWKNLSPLTPNKDEWMDITDMCDGNVTYQSKRNPACFTTDFKTFYDVDKKRKEKGGIDNPWSFEEELKRNENEVEAGMMDEYNFVRGWVSPDGEVMELDEGRSSHHAKFIMENYKKFGYSKKSEVNLADSHEHIQKALRDGWTRFAFNPAHHSFTVNQSVINGRVIEELINKYNISKDIKVWVDTIGKNYTFENINELLDFLQSGVTASVGNSVNAWLSPEGKLYEFPINQSHQYYINKNFNISIGQAFEEGWTRIVPDNRDTYYATLSINGNKPFEWVWEQLPKEYKQVNIINVEDNEGHSDVIHMGKGGELLHRDRISANRKIEAEVMEYPAFWIDDSGKTYEVKEDDFTHSEWVLNNITMVSDKIPNIFDYLDVDMAEDDEDLEDWFEEEAETVYQAMYENGWTRVRKYNGNKGTLIEVDFPTPDKLKYAEDLVYRRGWKFDYIGLSPMGQDISAIPYDDVMSEKNWMRVYQKYKNMIMNSDNSDNVKVDSAMSTCVYDGDEDKTGTDELYFSMNVDNMKDLIYNPEFSRQLQFILQDKGNSKKPGKWGGSNLQLDHEEEHNTIFRDNNSRDKSNNLDDTMPPDIDLKHYTGILK